MDWSPVAFDWNQIRAFLVAAEEGSFSAAARSLGVTQPTLGRQVAALEEQLGVTLFQRGGRRLVPTESGLELLEHVRSMGDAALRVSLTASGQSQSIEGHVSITTTDLFAMHILPDAVERIREQAPGIEIEVIASNENRDLRRREADIAVRHGRPEQPDLIAKLVRETSAHLYASSDYLRRHGPITSPDQLRDATLIGFDRSGRQIEYLTQAGLPVTRDNFRLLSENGAVSWEFVKRGLGIAMMVREVAERTPGVEQVLPDLPPVPVPVWLVTHRELRTSRRIRLVYDLLAESLT